MSSWRAPIILGLTVCALSCSTGCALFHELQPHRLRRLNATPSPMRDAMFSVSDPVDNGEAFEQTESPVATANTASE